MRAASPPLDLIDVHRLRVGMYVHLDLGWMAHPFPVNSFRITTPQQVATIRALGLEQVHWNPRQSDQALAEYPAPGRSAASKAQASEDIATPLRTDTRLDVAAGPGVPALTSDRQRLRAQRAALRGCERRFTAAARACSRVNQLVQAEPQQARVEAETLTRSLAAEMSAAPDLCIRFLTESAGDKASMHALNVATVSMLLGRAFGFAEDDLVDLGVGALLHDIGKVGVAQQARHRDASLTSGERTEYEAHVAHGLVQARRMGLSAGATLVLAQHHEHADGSGFPSRLNSDRMSLEARIVALVDRYDNLCNPHFLDEALTPHEALSLLFTKSSAQYDTSILSGFIKMMGVYPPGSTVQLTDDRLAMVVSVSSSRALKPTVLVYEPRVPCDEALALDLETAGGIGIRRSIPLGQLPAAAREYLAPRRRVAYFFEPKDAAAEWERRR